MIPEIDKIIGIEVYSTDFQGINGKIKFDNSSFIVEEVIKDIKFIDNGYALYRLEKEGIDSIRALNHITKRYNIRLKIFGLKDANAKTVQYAIATKRGYYRDIIDKHCSLKFLGYVNNLTKNVLLGNKFTIIIRDHNANDLDEFEGYIDKIANFYGYQRFGSSKPITHLIGKAIIKRDFKQAVELLSDNDADYEHLVKVEYEKGRDAIKALRKVPIMIRRLFIDAYKSYIFNRTLSTILQQGYDLTAREGDICFQDGELRTFANKQSILAIPTVGYAFKTKNRFADIIDIIMKEEGIAYKDFYLKEMQEVSRQSGFRQALLNCRDFAYRLKPLTIQFMLDKGSYATILLRELMKPNDPIIAGF